MPKKPNTSYQVYFTVDDKFDSERFIKLRLRVCHDGVSPNKTYCTKETMEEANKESLFYIPLLAHCVYDEDGKPMIGAHDMHVEENRLHAGESKLIYDEIPIGVIPSLEDNNWSIEEFEGKSYTFCDAYVWKDYSNYIEDLIVDAVDTKLSMEISIPEDKLSYNAKEKYWNIEKYVYRGITLLNPDCGTGMKNALATTENFEEKNDLKEQMIVLMEQLNDCLCNYNNILSNEKGGNVEVKLFDELLIKYGKTLEDIDFEYENLDDEALKQKFEEVFGSIEAEEEPTEDFTENNEDDSAEENNTEEVETTEEFDNEEGETSEENEEVDETEESGNETDQVEETNSEEFSREEMFQKVFQLSHDEIHCGLNALISVYRNEDEWCYVSEVYDDYFIMEDWDSEKLYKQSYTKEEDTLSLNGERTQMFKVIVTESEKLALDEMRANYSSIQEKLAKYEKAELDAQKEEVLSDEAYVEFAESEEFKSLKENMDNYSVEELREKAELAFAKCVKAKGSFSLNVITEEKPEKKQPKKVSVSRIYTEDSNSDYKPYGDLFDEE